VGSVTVRQALRLLSEEGIVVSERGRGTSVTRALTPAQENSSLLLAINDPLELGPDQTIDVLKKERVKRLPASLEVAGKPGADYMRIVKTHLHAGEVFSAMEIYVDGEAYARFPRGAEKKFKIGRLIRECGGVKLKSLRQQMTIATLDDATARLMGIDPSAYYLAGIVVRVLRWWLDSDGRIAVAGIHYYRADMFVLDFTQDAPPDGLLPSATLPAARPRMKDSESASTSVASVVHPERQSRK